MEKGDIFGVIGFSGAGEIHPAADGECPGDPYGGPCGDRRQIIDQLSHNELRKVRKKIGMIFQQFNLLDSRTVYENVAIPLRLNHTEPVQLDRTVKTLLQFVGLEDKAGSIPSSCPGDRNRGWALPGPGHQSQHPALRRSHQRSGSGNHGTDPAAAPADQPGTEDHHLFVTHQIQVIQQLCNKVAVMEHGRVVEQGSVLEVFSNPQQEITRKFVRTVIPDTIPESIQEDLKKDPRPFRLLKLRFLGRQASEGDISVLSEEIGLKTNIVFATVTELQQTAWASSSSSVWMKGTSWPGARNI